MIDWNGDGRLDPTEAVLTDMLLSQLRNAEDDAEDDGEDGTEDDWIDDTIRRREAGGHDGGRQDL